MRDIKAYLSLTLDDGLVDLARRDVVVSAC